MKKIILILMCIFVFSGCEKCIKSHTETKYRQPYNTYRLVGKILMPVYHDGYYYEDNVCDEYEKKLIFKSL